MGDVCAGLVEAQVASSSKPGRLGPRGELVLGSSWTAGDPGGQVIPSTGTEMSAIYNPPAVRHDIVRLLLKTT